MTLNFGDKWVNCGLVSVQEGIQLLILADSLIQELIYVVVVSLGARHFAPSLLCLLYLLCFGFSRRRLALDQGEDLLELPLLGEIVAIVLLGILLVIKVSKELSNGPFESVESSVLDVFEPTFVHHVLSVIRPVFKCLRSVIHLAMPVLSVI